MEWYVYLLKCSDGTLYCGSTTDLIRRLEEHARGKGARYTRGRLPIRLVAFAGTHDRSSAQKLEARVKRKRPLQKVLLLEHARNQSDENNRWRFDKIGEERQI